MSNIKSFEEASGGVFGDILSEKREKKPVRSVYLPEDILNIGECSRKTYRKM